HFDAVRVCGTFGEDAGHDALRQCAGALVLLLHDLHAQPRANFTAYGHTHSFSVSCFYGVLSNQEPLQFEVQTDVVHPSGMSIGWLRSRWEEIDPRQEKRPRRRYDRMTAA